MVKQTRRFAIWVEVVWTAGLVACGLASTASAQQPFVDKFVLADTIQPITRANRPGHSARQLRRR